MGRDQGVGIKLSNTLVLQVAGDGLIMHCCKKDLVTETEARDSPLNGDSSEIDQVTGTVMAGDQSRKDVSDLTADLLSLKKHILLVAGM